VKLLTGLSHAELSKLAADVPPGCAGLLWLPFLVGERVPDLPLATGTLLGLRPGLLRAGHLYRAALEGTSLNLGAGLDRLRGLGLQIAEVRVTGGASQNPLWRQILANVFDVPVRPLLEAEVGGARRRAAGGMVRATPRGRENLGTDAVAAPFVRLGAETRPDAALRSQHDSMRSRFDTEVARQHPRVAELVRAWQHVAFDGAGPPAIPWWHVDTSQDRFGVAGQGYPSSADARHDARRHPRFRSGLLPAR
jgi:sugar (pentulose or hexulose) kinase